MDIIQGYLFFSGLKKSSSIKAECVNDHIQCHYNLASSPCDAANYSQLKKEKNCLKVITFLNSQAAWHFD